MCYLCPNGIRFYRCCNFPRDIFRQLIQLFLINSYVFLIAPITMYTHNL